MAIVMGICINKQNPLNAPKLKIHIRDTDSDAVFHSDGGGQYGGIAFRLPFKPYNMVRNVFRKAESTTTRNDSFMGTTKKELLQGSVFEPYKNA